MSSRNRKRTWFAASQDDKSFVSSIALHISGIIPKSVKKWFEPSESKTNGSAVAADFTDTSTEDEAGDILATNPEKKPRYSSNTQDQRNSSSYEINDVHNTIDNKSYSKITNDVAKGCIPCDSGGSSTERTSFSKELSYIPTSVNSTSKDLYVEEPKDITVTMNKSQYSISHRNDYSKIRRVSLEHKNKKSSDNDFSGPTSKIQTNHTFIGSPFYEGHTRYGGASSTFVNKPNVQHRVLPLDIKKGDKKAFDGDNSISTATKQMSAMLDKYFAPILEVKRVQPYVNTTVRNNSACKRNTIPPEKAYKYRSLPTPSLASVLRLKKRDHFLKSSVVARQIMASNSSTSDISTTSYPYKNNEQSYTTYSSKGNTKIKSRLTRIHGRNDLESDPLPSFTLPSGGLEIDKDNLPQFSFETSQNNSDRSKKTNGDFSFSNPVLVSSEQPQNDTSPPKFKFDNPSKTVDRKLDVVSHFVGTAYSEANGDKDRPVQCSESRAQNKPDAQKFVSSGVDTIVKLSCTSCKISESLPNKDLCSSCENSKKFNNEKCTVAKQNEVSISVDTEWKCDDCWVKNKPNVNKCVACGGQKPPNKQKPSNDNKIMRLKEPFTFQPMWHSKEADLDKCDSNKTVLKDVPSTSINSTTVNQSFEKCGTNKLVPKDAPSTNTNNYVTVEQNNTLINNMPKNTQKKDVWVCSDCWVNNNMSVDKCVACGGSKPGLKNDNQSYNSANASFKPASSDIFGSPTAAFQTKPISSTKQPKSDLTKTELSTWKCSCCFSVNDSDLSKCNCCESFRPGSRDDILLKRFNFGSGNASKFKFGINKQENDNTDSKKNEEIDKQVESEKNNNILTQKPQFSFGIPNCMSSPVKQSDKPPLGINFGIPAKVSSDSTVSAVNTSPPKDTLGSNLTSPKTMFGQINPEEKKQEVLSFTASEDNPKTKTLTMPAVTQDAAFINFGKPVVTSSNKTETSTSALQFTTSSNSVLQSSSKFTFSTGSETSLNLFAKPASTEASITLVTMPRSETTTSVTTAATFQNPDVVTTTTASFPLYQAPKTSTLSASSDLPAPSFNFLGNTKSQTTQPSQQFNFGGVKTDSLFGKPSTGTNSWTVPATTTNSQTTQFTFGSNKPSTTAFGSNNLSNTNSMFGNPSGNANSSGTFPANNQPSQPPAFGMTSSPAFGASQTTSSQASTFGTGQAAPLAQTPAQPTFGSAPSATSAQLNFESMQPMTAAQLIFGSAQPIFGTAQPIFGSTQTGTAAQPIFGSAQTPAAAQPIFGSTQTGTAAQPIFGSAQQTGTPTQPLFGSAQTGTASQPIFGSAQSGTAVTPIFGCTQPATPAFGAAQTGTPAQPTFGATQAATPPQPTFGSPQASNNMFQMLNQNLNTPPSMFGSNTAQPAPLFGSPQAANNTSSSLGMFNSTTPAFGSTSTPSPAPAFKFGDFNTQPHVVFGFAQQQPGVYNFGASPGGSTMKFNMGTGPTSGVSNSIATRRIRKPRRTTHR